MPLLLTQKRPFVRSFLFLGGSFMALLLMGLLFAQGFGSIVLRFENAHTWIIPGVEAAAGIVLLVIGGALWWRTKSTKMTAEEPSVTMVKRLQLNNWLLFGFGSILVSVQSLIDVVFVIAMIHTGQLHLSAIETVAAVTTYALTALALQLAVVIAYGLAPPQRRTQTLGNVHRLLTRYANQATMIISLALGMLLFADGVLTAIGAPHV